MSGSVEQSAGPPPGRVPGLVALRQYVAQAEHAVVMLLEARAYSQGCLLEFLAVCRPPGSASAPGGASPSFRFDLGDGVLLGDREPVPAGHPRSLRRLDDRETSTPDGRQSGVVGHGPRLWLAPLPPVEGFTVLTDWPEFGIVCEPARIDGQAIRQAAWDSFPALPA